MGKISEIRPLWPIIVFVIIGILFLIFGLKPLLTFNETSIVTITNKLHGSSVWYVKGRDNPEDYYILIDIDKEKELATTPDILLDHLSLLLLNGQMSTELRSAVKEMIEYHNVKNTERRVTEAIFLIMSSPEAAVLK